jgi:hypothetical protein
VLISFEIGNKSCEKIEIIERHGVWKRNSEECFQVQQFEGFSVSSSLRAFQCLQACGLSSVFKLEGFPVSSSLRAFQCLQACGLSSVFKLEGFPVSSSLWAFQCLQACGLSSVFKLEGFPVPSSLRAFQCLQVRWLSSVLKFDGFPAPSTSTILVFFSTFFHVSPHPNHQQTHLNLFINFIRLFFIISCTTFNCLRFKIIDFLQKCLDLLCLDDPVQPNETDLLRVSFTFKC